MKIDMSPAAVTRRLKNARDLRRACLSLADSSMGRLVRSKHPSHKEIRKTDRALGR